MHTGPYRVEIHFGHGWEWYADTDLYIEALRWERALKEWPTRIIDTPTGRIIRST